MASGEALRRPSVGGGAAKRKERMMDGNFTIGRFGGVEVRLHWSLIAVFALIVWSLADGVFPSQNPGLSDGAYLGAAIVAALLFLASILLHELGHSWVARREGIEVDSVTLWLFGGVAEFKDRFASAGAEFRVALSGPLVSIGLGVLFVAIALAGLPSAVDGAAAWLGYINLILAAFNLLPASPLDGGRVLHAALWRAKGDYAWATRVASEIGQGFGYLFIALGLVMFIFQGSFSGAWLAFIGWYLLQGAKAEARYVATEQALGGLRVRDLMVRRPRYRRRRLDDWARHGRRRLVAPVHYLPRPRWGQSGRTAPLRLGCGGTPLGVGDATRAGDDDLARRGPAAHRGREGPGRLGGAFRAGRESWARGRQRAPRRASLDHRSRASARGWPKAGSGTGRSRLIGLVRTSAAATRRSSPRTSSTKRTPRPRWRS